MAVDEFLGIEIDDDSRDALDDHQLAEEDGHHPLHCNLDRSLVVHLVAYQDDSLDDVAPLVVEVPLVDDLTQHPDRPFVACCMLLDSFVVAAVPTKQCAYNQLLARLKLPVAAVNDVVAVLVVYVVAYLLDESVQSAGDNQLLSNNLQQTYQLYTLNPTVYQMLSAMLVFATSKMENVIA